MQSAKRILVCGYPRSGTTMLYYAMLEKFSEKTLYEPCNPQVLRWYRQYLKYKDIESHIKNKTHPYFKEKIDKIIIPYIRFFNYEGLYKHFVHWYPGDGFIKDIIKLEKFLSFFRGFNIKDISLHFYLDIDFIQNYWDVYFIIRNPADVYISHIKSAPNIEYLKYKVYSLIKKIKILGEIYSKIFFNFNNQVLGQLALNKVPCSPEERFIFFWTITNYHAIKTLPKDKIIIYENKKSYKKLPFEIKEEEIRIKRYKDRDKYMKIFEQAVAEMGIDDMFEYLMRLITCQ